MGRHAFITWFTEVCAVDAEIDLALANLDKWTLEVHCDTPLHLAPAKSQLKYEPLGVVLVIGSWNFPFYTVLAPMVNAIGAGNACLVKPSELTPFSSNTISNLIKSSLDSNFYKCIEG